MTTTTDYDYNVFINCPFDRDYAAIFDAIVFAVHDCGFVARCALEVSDSAQVRIERLFRIIEECRYGVHDISRTELDEANGLPRFNMPLELGVFLGARRFGVERQQAKACLVLDYEPYRYQKFCSDIAGQDIKYYGSDPDEQPPKAIYAVRNWLRSVPASRDVRLPSGKKIVERFEAFLKDLPRQCEESNLDRHDLIYNDYTGLVVEWIRASHRTKI